MNSKNIHFKVLPNANQIASNLLHENNVQAFYKGMLDEYKNGYQTIFAATFQIMVTKIGQVLLKCLSNPPKFKNYYIGHVNFICNSILHDPNLYQKLEKYNKTGNNTKHSLTNIKINIAQAVSIYNELINKIVAKTKISSFRCIIINAEKNIQNQQTYQDYYKDLHNAWKNVPQPQQQNKKQSQPLCRVKQSKESHSINNSNKNRLTILQNERERLDKQISDLEIKFSKLSLFDIPAKKNLKQQISDLRESKETVQNNIAIYELERDIQSKEDKINSEKQKCIEKNNQIDHKLNKISMIHFIKRGKLQKEKRKNANEFYSSKKIIDREILKENRKIDHLKNKK